MIVLKERGIDAMGEYLRNINWKHVLIMCIGNVFAGMGIGIFKLAGLGTDPFSGMNMAVADMIGMAYGNFQLIVNIVLLIIEIAFGRRFLGIGTVVNAVCLAYIITFFYNIFHPTIPPPTTRTFLPAALFPSRRSEPWMMAGLSIPSIGRIRVLEPVAMITLSGFSSLISSGVTSQLITILTPSFWQRWM